MKGKSGSYTSVWLPVNEKEAMEDAVAKSGMPRNAWLREVIAKAAEKLRKR